MISFIILLKDSYTEIMEHKEIDHNAAHLTWGNQFLHLVSSVMMIYVYYLLCCSVSGLDCSVRGLDCSVRGLDSDKYVKLAALMTISAQTMRQGGHFFIEGNAKHKERLKIGYTTDMKKKAIYGFLPFIFVNWYYIPFFHSWVNGYELAMLSYAAIILYRVSWLTFYGDHSLQGLIWWCKIFSDVFTDIHLYGPTIWGETAPKMYVWTTPEVNFYNDISL